MKSRITFWILVLCVCAVPKLHAQETTTTDTREVKAVKDSAGAQVTTVHSESTVEIIKPVGDMIVTNPLKFALFYNLGYMHRLSEHFAVGGSIQTPTPKNINGIGFLAEGRWYPGKHNLRGFYVAPNISFNSISVPFEESSYDQNGNYTGSTSTKSSFTATSIGVLIGWQWFPGDDFAIGLGIGIDNYWLSGSSNDYLGFSDLSGKVPAFRLDIGYGW